MNSYINYSIKIKFYLLLMQIIGATLYRANTLCGHSQNFRYLDYLFLNIKPLFKGKIVIPLITNYYLIALW